MRKTLQRTAERCMALSGIVNDCSLFWRPFDADFKFPERENKKGGNCIHKSCKHEEYLIDPLGDLTPPYE